MAARKTDCGLEVVRHLFDVLELEEKGCLRDERGFTVIVDGATLRIEPRAPQGWLVLRGGETLGEHAGVPGLLRHLRDELAPHAKRGRLIIAAQ